MGSRPRQVGIVRGREAVGDLGAGASRGNAHHRPGRGHVPFGPGCRGKGGTSFHGDGKHADSGRASHVGDVACEEGDGDGRRWHRCRRPPPTDAETCALRGLSRHVVGTNNGSTGVRIAIWVAPHVLQHRTCEHRRPSPGIARHASRRPPVGTSATGPAARQRTQAADLPAMGRDRPMRAASFALAMQPSRGSSRRIARSEWPNGFDSSGSTGEIFLF